jgi:hypothetical protein
MSLSMLAELIHIASTSPERTVPEQDSLGKSAEGFLEMAR